MDMFSQPCFRTYFRQGVPQSRVFRYFGDVIGLFFWLTLHCLSPSHPYLLGSAPLPPVVLGTCSLTVLTSDPQKHEFRASGRLTLSKTQGRESHRRQTFFCEGEVDREYVFFFKIPHGVDAYTLFLSGISYHRVSSRSLQPSAIKRCYGIELLS